MVLEFLGDRKVGDFFADQNILNAEHVEKHFMRLRGLGFSSSHCYLLLFSFINTHKQISLMSELMRRLFKDQEILSSSRLDCCEWLSEVAPQLIDENILLVYLEALKVGRTREKLAAYFFRLSFSDQNNCAKFYTLIFHRNFFFLLQDIVYFKHYELVRYLLTLYRAEFGISGAFYNHFLTILLSGMPLVESELFMAHFFKDGV